MAPDNGDDATAAAEEDAAGSAWWIWLLALIGIGGAAAAIWFSRRQQAESVEFEPAPLVRAKPVPQAKTANEPEPEKTAPVRDDTLSVPAPSLATAPVVTPAPAASEVPSRLEVDFQPLAARLSTLGLTLSYRLTLFNISDETVRDFSVRLGIRSADDPATEDGSHAGSPCLTLDSLEAGASQEHVGEIVLDPQTFKPYQSKGKPMLVPVVDMYPRYRDVDGHMHEMHAAMIVGRELQPPRQRMQPFWLESGFGQFGMLGCRMLSVRTS